ncbi:hypothetical protein BKA64DRAFT_756370 [Cadophora sp. MPI-SDFR-AT-0126]|nr:hypothetical protein BKA64DRAFT_756370 [Leotiomycetes sp. MPI-SDFR-AT-0126]
MAIDMEKCGTPGEDVTSATLSIKVSLGTKLGRIDGSKISSRTHRSMYRICLDVGDEYVLDEKGAALRNELVARVIGSISFGLGIVALIILPSSPLQYIFLKPDKKIVAVWRVADNKMEVKNEKVQIHQIKEAAWDAKMYFVAMLSLMIDILNGSVANFFSALLAGFGYDSQKVLMYKLPGGAFALICTTFGGLLGSYIPGILCLPSILALLPGLAANGVLFVYFGIGNIVVPFLFLPGEKPRYLTAIKVLAGMYAGCILIVAGLYVTMATENRRRDRNPVLQGDGTEEGFADMTDKENKAFRYKL